jgi:tRNA(Ile)-lysidine synthetase-like protein
MTTIQLPNPEFAATTPIFVAFSGGVDSTALLLWARSHFIKVHAVHFNHGWPASNTLQAHVETTCSNLKVPLLIGTATAPCPTETLAREARYAFLHATIPSGALLALGHNLEEQLETVIYQISRGATKVPGMETTSVRNEGDKVLTYYRPFLKIQKQALLAFCKEANVQWIEDPTNLDTDTVRNHIRHDILPLLAGLNHNSLEHWSRFFTDLKQAQTLHTVPQSLITRSELSTHDLRALPESNQREVLSNWLKHKGVTTFSNKHITSCLSVINGTTERTQLPKKVLLCRKEGQIFLKHAV